MTFKSLIRSTAAFAGLATAAAVLPVSAAKAQGQPDTQAEAEVVEETNEVEGDQIIVRARRRDENLLEVPVAITALTEENLRSANAFGLEDVAQLTPGLNFSNLPGGIAEPTIRGLAQTDQLGVIGNVGVFIDGVFINNRAAIEFGNLDLAQIEVLKGPQSALFGRDTFAGAINYRTKGAVLGEFDGVVEGQIGSDELYSIRGSLNIPIGEHFAIRLFGGTSRFDGTIPNVRANGLENLGGWDERTTFGAQALFEMGPVKVRLFGAKNINEEDNPANRILDFDQNTGGTEYLLDDGNGGTFSLFTLPTGDFPNPDTVSIDPRGRGLDGSFELYYGIIDVDLDFATLSATASYSESSYSSFFDNAADPEAINRPFFGRFTDQFFTDQTGDRSEQESYELRLTSNPGSAFDWQFGYVHFDSTAGGVLSTTTPLLADPDTLETITRVEERIVQNIDAIFGAVSIPATDKLNVSAEFRYTWEDQQLTDQADIFFFPALSRPLTSIPAEFDYWSGRIGADYTFDNGLMLYGLIARGVKTGGINGGAQGTEFATFDPETNITYEIGAKGSLLNGRLVMNAAVFHIEWQDLQSTAPASLEAGPVVINGIGEPTSTGLEFDATWDVTDAFQLRVATAIIDPTYGDNFTDQANDGSCPLNPPQPTAQVCSSTVNGTRINRTPTFTFFGSASYTWEQVLGDFDAFVRADYSHEGDRFATSLNLARLTPINLVNLRAGIRSDNTEFALWMDNALDENYLGRATPFTDPRATPLCRSCGVRSTRLSIANGRTFGLTATRRF